MLLNDDSSPRASPTPRKISLVAVASFDPYGDDGEEHEGEVGNAVDGNSETYWPTSTYSYGGGELGKAGVGIVLGARRRESPSTIRVTTDTPGFRAEIQAGNLPDGDFETVSPARIVGGITTFPIREDTAARFFVVWIVNLGENSRVHINEVRAG